MDNASDYGSEDSRFDSWLARDDALDHSLGTMSMSVSGTNLYEAARLSGGSSIIENLQSQLKLREGEIAQLQVKQKVKTSPA
ncbi:TATA element modulatory factor 1 [Goodea atripinnis]|uniref:TATA element modulatory factor 1 n=1 Tax=Goodea atripinnis TaxID=208336 RepID=A0ABV0MXY1_9TELE